MRDKSEIERQVEGLLIYRKKLQKVCCLGNENHDAIDAQIEIIEGRDRASDYSDKKVYSTFIYDMAIMSQEWIDCEIDDDLFQDMWY